MMLTAQLREYGKRKKTEKVKNEKKKGRDRIILSNGEVDNYGHLIDTCDR